MTRPARRLSSTRTTTFGSRLGRLAAARWGPFQETSQTSPESVFALSVFAVHCSRSDGTLASPVMSWMDERVSRPYEHKDPNVRYVTTSSGYITHRMTGEFKDTAANYAGVWPISTDRWEWLRDDEGFSKYQIAREMLFELVMPGDVLGSVTPEASRHTGIPAGPACLRYCQRQGRRGPWVRASLVRHLVGLIGDLHRQHDDRRAQHRRTPELLVQLRLHPASSTCMRAMASAAGCGQSAGGETCSVRRRNGGRERRPARSRSISTSRQRRWHPGRTVSWWSLTGWRRQTLRSRRARSSASTCATAGSTSIERYSRESLSRSIAAPRPWEQETGMTYKRLVVSGGGSNSDVFMQIFADVFGMPGPSEQDEQRRRAGLSDLRGGRVGPLRFVGRSH